MNFFDEHAILRLLFFGARTLRMSLHVSVAQMAGCFRMPVRTAFLCSSVLLLLPLQQGLVKPSIGLFSQGPRDVVSVNVDLINVSASVIDDAGNYVQGLTADDFQVFEDGQQQKISFFSYDSGVPVSVGVLIDTSSSLQEKLRQGLQTAREIARRLSPGDEMFVVMFNSHDDVRQTFTNDPE